jgi:hypothetical protein
MAATAAAPSPRLIEAQHRVAAVVAVDEHAQGCVEQRQGSQLNPGQSRSLLEPGRMYLSQPGKGATVVPLAPAGERSFLGATEDWDHVGTTRHEPMLNNLRVRQRHATPRDRWNRW